MSFCRDGVVWPTQGGYRYGMFACEQIGEDEEWDVEYLDEFSFVSPVMPTIEEAFHAWDGCNPGGFMASSVEGEYDDLAARWEAQEAERRTRTVPYWL